MYVQQAKLLTTPLKNSLVFTCYVLFACSCLWALAHRWSYYFRVMQMANNIILFFFSWKLDQCPVHGTVTWLVYRIEASQPQLQSWTTLWQDVTFRIVYSKINYFPRRSEKCDISVTWLDIYWSHGKLSGRWLGISAVLAYICMPVVPAQTACCCLMLPRGCHCQHSNELNNLDSEVKRKYPWRGSVTCGGRCWGGVFPFVTPL